MGFPSPAQDHIEQRLNLNSGIITQDGETIDGQGLDGVVVLGKVTAEILAVYEPYRPII